jgi:hypothetical protein
LEAGKLIDQSPSAIKLRLYQTSKYCRKNSYTFHSQKVCLEKEKENKTKNKKKKEKR